MSYIHWLKFESKIRVIEACEKRLGIKANFYKPRFPVQGIILLIYFFILSILGGWLTWLRWREPKNSFIVFIGCVVLGLIICVGVRLYVKKRIDKEFSEPLKVETRNE